jgi:hypothetical protein
MDRIDRMPWFKMGRIRCDVSVYRSVLLRDQDRLFSEAKNLLASLDCARKSVSLVEDENVMFGQAELIHYQRRKCDCPAPQCVPVEVVREMPAGLQAFPY